MLFAALVAAQVNLQDSNAVAQYAKKMATQAINYYKVKPGGDGQGAVMPNTAEDASGIQWFESGIYWGALMEYSRAFKDDDFMNDISGALGLASHNEVGSFLGALTEVAATLQGKWNDDILWWGLSTMTGAELFGKDAKLPSGKTFFEVAQQTYNEVWQQWDDKCGGGIYFSRDRKNVKNGSYKSTITNVQHMMMGARLYMLTKNQTYIDNAKKVNEWLRKGIVRANGAVFDGLNVTEKCGVHSNEYTYTAGYLMGAQGWLFKATNDNMWISQSSTVLSHSIQTFTKDGVLVDPCETSSCKPNEVPFKGPFSQGVSYLAGFTNNNNDKEAIQKILKASMEGMLKTCDGNANCNSVWTPGGSKNSNFHTQIAALQLINSFAAAGSGPLNQVTFKAPAAPPVEILPKNRALSSNFPSIIFMLVVYFIY